MSSTVSAIGERLLMILFSFGAAAFVTLAVSYWRARGRSMAPFGLFSLACAGAFATNLVLAFSPGAGWEIDLLQSVCSGLLPPLLVHVVVDRWSAGRAFRRFWSVVLWTFYGISLPIACARGLVPSDGLDTAAGILLAVAAGLALLQLTFSDVTPGVELRECRWMAGIFCALLGCAVAGVLTDHPALAIAPDYLILLFFAVHLYYSERLRFFDVFFKGGAYFAAGLVFLGIVAAAVLKVSPRYAAGDRVWVAVLLLMPAWLAAPPLAAWLGRWVDQRVLRRRYSPAAAEAMFLQVVQSATSEEQLLHNAAECLENVFACRVRIDLDGQPVQVEASDLLTKVVPNGVIHLQGSGRASPLLSEEQSLLEGLAVILGNAVHAQRLSRLREQQHAREEELRALAARAELRALRAQINPHFLFNALNAVASCIRTRPEVADETVVQLAEVFRYTLSRCEKEWVCLAEELEFVRSYLAVEQTRFGDRLQVQIRADSAAQAELVPAMILQPIVENAIKHGTSQMTAVGMVEVDACVVDRVLTIRVSDNGPGFPLPIRIDQASGGHGLQNVVERLRRHYGVAGGLQWQNGSEKTIVTIEIPTEAIHQCAS